MNTIHPIDGEHREHYADGSLSRRAFYKKGMIDGEYSEWYMNGSILTRRFYKNGIPDGKCAIFYRDGTIAESCLFSDGRLEGKYESWYGVDSQSRIKGIEFYRKGDVYSCEYWRDGKLIDRQFTYKKKAIFLKLKNSRKLHFDKFLIPDLEGLS